MTDPTIADLVGDLPFDAAALRDKYREERDKRLRSDGNEQYVDGGLSVVALSAAPQAEGASCTATSN